MHILDPMRTHLQIIKDQGGYQAVADLLKQPRERVRFWERRGAFPPEQWKAVADAGVATLEELATAAAAAKAQASTQADAQDAAA